MGTLYSITEDCPELGLLCQGIARTLLSFMSTHKEETEGK